MVLVQGMGSLMKGDYLVLVAAGLQGLAAVISKVLTRQFAVGPFVFARNLFSAILFFVIAVRWYGWEHFADAFLPSLWLVMGLYALVVVVIGQLAWYSALRSVAAERVASWSMLTPGLGLLFAWLLLDEVPNLAQWTGGLIILVGMMVTRLGNKAPPPAMLESQLAAAPGAPREY